MGEKPKPLCSNKPPRWSSCTIQFENYQTRSVISISHTDSNNSCCLHLLPWLIGEKKTSAKMSCWNSWGLPKTVMKWSDSGKGPNRSYVFHAFMEGWCRNPGLTWNSRVVALKLQTHFAFKCRPGVPFWASPYLAGELQQLSPGTRSQDQTLPSHQ